MIKQSKVPGSIIVGVVKKRGGGGGRSCSQASVASTNTFDFSIYNTFGIEIYEWGRWHTYFGAFNDILVC